MISPDDWIPLIDAMGYFRHLPKCGDVAQVLMDLFIAAADERDALVTVQYVGEDGKPVTEFIKTSPELALSEEKEDFT